MVLKGVGVLDYSSPAAVYYLSPEIPRAIICKSPLWESCPQELCCTAKVVLLSSAAHPYPSCRLYKQRRAFPCPILHIQYYERATEARCRRSSSWRLNAASVHTFMGGFGGTKDIDFVGASQHCLYPLIMLPLHHNYPLH